MGAGFFGFGGSDSTANDSKQVGGDAAIQIRGSNNARVSQPGSTLIDLTKGKVNTGLQIKGGVKGGIVINDTAPLSALASQFSDTVKTITSQSSDALGSVIKQQGATVTDLGTNAQTGGDASRNKIVLYVVLAVLGLMAWVFSRK